MKANRCRSFQPVLDVLPARLAPGGIGILFTPMPPTEIDYTLEVITPPPAIPMPKVEYELVTTSLPEHCF